MRRRRRRWWWWWWWWWSPNTVSTPVAKSARIRWSGHIARTDTSTIYSFVGNHMEQSKRNTREMNNKKDQNRLYR